VSQDPSQVFSQSNLANQAGQTHQGAGSSELKDAMNTLMKDPPPTGEELEKALEKLAKARGIPLDKLKKQYEKFLKVKEQMKQNAAAKGLPMPEGLSATQADFMGSEQQLDSGELIGQTFGMDAVFGAMLNPQGGMADGAVIPQADTAAGLHEATADASQYLQSFHNLNTGGRNYLGAGQDPMAFWGQQMQRIFSKV
jgi:hypothetical protein